MFKNYVLTALRTFKRNKLYTLINVAGLGLSIACAVVIFSLIRYHLSFDGFHNDTKHVYRITTNLNIGETKHITGTPYPLADAFRSDYPFADLVTRVFHEDNLLVTINPGTTEQKFEEKVAFADPDFFKMFNFPMSIGTAEVLSKPNSAIISQRLANKYFGGNNAIGKSIRIDGKLDAVIAAVMKDLPVNTDRTQEIYVSFADLKILQPWLTADKWTNVNDNMQVFVRLKPGVTAEKIDAVFPAFIRKYYAEKDAIQWAFKLQPLADIHLDTEFGASVGRESLVALACIGLFLVLAACINFINLATAQAISRSKEIGVRKVLGGTRSQLFWQFIVETAMISILALIIALAFAELVLPSVNQLFQAKLDISLFTDSYLIGFLTCLLIFTVISSGCYPGLILAGIQPVLALKGKISHGSSGSMSLRKGLVVTQFAISQLLIIGTIVIVNQMHYAQQADVGFIKDGIVILPLPDFQASKISIMKTEMEKIKGVKGLTYCYGPPAYEDANLTKIRVGNHSEPEKFQISFRAADADYASVFGLKLMAGRNVFPSDTVKEFLINQTTVRMLGLKSNNEVLGKQIEVNGYKGEVVGVVKDFHNKSFHAAIEPLALTTFRVWYSSCAVKLDMGNLEETLSAVERTWKKRYPDHLYKQEFMDEQIAKRYENDEMMMTLIQVFTFIAIFIGCLSLYGLVSFMATQKRREIAVRKVLGASVKSIVLLFVREFGLLMVIAFMLAAPLGWWVMQNWLRNFAYRIDLGPGIFLLALGTTFFIVALTVGYKSVVTALADPSKSLRAD